MIPRYQMVAIALVILAGIVVTMLQDGTWLRHIIDGTCDQLDCLPTMHKPMGAGAASIRR